jgi:hypothetical protein
MKGINQRYTVGTLVNVTMYPQYNYNMLINKEKGWGKIMVSKIYIVSSRPAWATQRDPVSKPPLSKQERKWKHTKCPDKTTRTTRKDVGNKNRNKTKGNNYKTVTNVLAINPKIKKIIFYGQTW